MRYANWALKQLRVPVLCFCKIVVYFGFTHMPQKGRGLLHPVSGVHGSLIRHRLHAVLAAIFYNLRWPRRQIISYETTGTILRHGTHKK